MEDNKFPREVTLCLSGGAARGAFHLGAISILEENSINIKAISGTSIGALIGASLACGKKSKDILKTLKSREFKKVFKLSLGNGYIFKIDRSSPILNALVDKNSFEALDIPLEISVCDVENAKVIYENSGDNLKELVLASCSITPLIQPVPLNNKLLVDGGLIDNFPVERLHKYPYPILGINLYPNSKVKVTSLFGWLKKIMFVAWQSHNLRKENLCDIYLSSAKLNEVSALSFKDVDKAFELGRVEMQQILGLTS